MSAHPTPYPSTPAVRPALSHGTAAARGYAGTYAGVAGRGPAPRPAAPAADAPAGASAAAGPVPTLVGGTVSPATLDALLDALRSERKLLDDLASTMRRQRAAVGGEDLDGVDDSVFATHRILATLGQARLRRRAVNRLVVGVEELPVRMLEQVLGGQMTDEMRDARDGLQESAGVLSREVEINRRVLREALAAGDAHARVLNGTGASIDSPMAAAAARALLDRTA